MIPNESLMADDAHKKYLNKLDESNHCIAISKQGVLLFANKRLIELSGMDTDQFYGKHYSELLSSFNASELEDLLNNVQEDKLTFEAFHTELEISQDRYIEVELSLVGIEYEGEAATLVILRDLSKQIEIMEELENSQHKLRFLTQSAFEGIILHANGIVLDVNENFARNMGLTREESIGKSLFDYIKEPTDKELLLEKMKLKDAKPYLMELQKENGETFMSEIESKAIEYKGQNVRIAAVRDVSERYRLQQELHKSEQRLSNLLSNLQGVAYRCIWEKDWTMKYLSAGCLELTEYLPVQIIDNKELSFNELIYEEDRNRVWEEINTALINDDPFELKYRIKTRFGKIKWVFEKGKQVLEEDGVKYLEGFISDITQMHQTETEVWKQRQVIESIYRAAPSGIGWVINRVLTKVNPMMCEITQYSEQEMLGKSARFLYPSQEEFERVGTDKYAQINEKGLGTIETQWLRKDGKVIDILLSSSPIDLDDYSKGVIFTALEITEQKEHERNLQLSETRLLRSQTLSKTGSWRIDLNTMEVSASEQARLIYGFEEMKTVSPQDVQDLHCEEYRERLDVALDKLIKGEADYKETFRLKNKKTGEILDVMSLAEYDPVKRVIEGTIQDISDIKGVERELILRNKELRLAKEKAEESDRLKSAFLANISHEIRTPMNGIIGFTNILNQPDIPGHKQKQYLEIIQKSGFRMLSTLNDLIDISKIEAGQMELNIDDMMLSTFMDEIYRFFEPEFQRKQLAFTCSIAPDLEALVFKSDHVKLHSIISNLLKNAIKFTKVGGVELMVEKVNGHLQFMVMDSGIGIPADRQGVIFERFMQADIFDKDVYEGSGLGLSIAKSFVEMLDGEIWFTSQEGSGSLFYVKIPLKQEQNVSVEKELLTPADSALEGLKVLIAEDDETAMQYMSVVVGEFASEVQYARDGMAAVRVIEKNPDINLVLMDLKMPKLSGLEAAKQIRKFNPEVIIIAQTAYAMVGDREKALASGCDDYIAKPYRVDDLLEKIQQYFLRMGTQNEMS